MAALDYLTKDVAGAVDRYMSVLSHIGYKSYCAVDKLLVYLFIEEMLNMFLTITEEDYNTVANVINCFYGSCLIPFPIILRRMRRKKYIQFLEYLKMIYSDLLRVMN